MNVNPQNENQPVFKEAALKPLPAPIMLRRFSGEGGWHDTCSSILALTKVDWNNNTLYKTMPVTIGYSKVFADVVKLTPEIVDNVYDYRFFYVGLYSAQLSKSLGESPLFFHKPFNQPI